MEGLGSVDATLAEARRVFALQSAYKWLAKTSPVNERKEHLRRLRDEVVRRSADIERAIITDLPQPPSRGVHVRLASCAVRSTRPWRSWRSGRGR